MRRDQGPARLAVSALGAVVLVLAAVAVPIVTGAPRSGAADLVVIVGLGAAASRLALARREPIAVALFVAATVWTLTGLATSLPPAVELPAARLALVPHAIVVVALATCLTGGRRLAVPVALAGAAALAAGMGVDLPVLALLGAALLTAALLADPGTPSSLRSATAVLGAALVAVDPQVLGDSLDPRTLVTAIDLLLLGIAATATRHLTSEPVPPFGADDTGAGGGYEEVGAWLARVLGVPRLRVAFPRGDSAVDSSGHPASYDDRALLVGDERGVVAYVSPAVEVDQSVHLPLVAMLRRLGEVAWLRAECREQAAAIAASTGRLQAAADEESGRLERQLDTTLLARLDRIDALLGASAGSALTSRVEEVRVELRRHARGLDPLAGRSLAQALTAHSDRGVLVEVGDLGEVHPTSARTAWYVATEGITNAIKHAPGAAIHLHAARSGSTLRLLVRDDGPGGVDPEGAGLQGLADRVAAARGQLTVRSGHDGTTVSCALPCTGNPAAGAREIADSVLSGRR